MKNSELIPLTTYTMLVDALDKNEHLHVLISRLERIEEAAQAVINHWDSIGWKDVKHTGDYINVLRCALKQSKDSK